MVNNQNLLKMNDLEMHNRLGHADIKTTLGTYSHLRPNAMKEVATRMTGKVVVSDNNIRKSRLMVISIELNCGK